LPTSVRPVAAISPEILQCVYVIVRKTRRITVRQLAVSTSVSLRVKSHHTRSWIFEGVREVGSSEPHSPYKT